MKSALVELRKQAEDAVRDMPEGDLKVSAFETFLKHLLSNAAGKESAPRGGSAAPSKVKSKPKDSVPQVPKSLGDRIRFLKSEGFFSSQRSIADIRSELKKNGWHYPVTSMSGQLQQLVQSRDLRREHTDDDEGRKGWKYSNP
jgi:cell division septation protein DedD